MEVFLKILRQDDLMSLVGVVIVGLFAVKLFGGDRGRGGAKFTAALSVIAFLIYSWSVKSPRHAEGLQDLFLRSLCAGGIGYTRTQLAFMCNSLQFKDDETRQTFVNQTDQVIFRSRDPDLADFVAKTLRGAFDPNKVIREEEVHRTTPEVEYEEQITTTEGPNGKTKSRRFVPVTKHRERIEKQKTYDTSANWQFMKAGDIQEAPPGLAWVAPSSSKPFLFPVPMIEDSWEGEYEDAAHRCIDGLIARHWEAGERRPDLRLVDHQIDFEIDTGSMGYRDIETDRFSAYELSPDWVVWVCCGGFGSSAQTRLRGLRSLAFSTIDHCAVFCTLPDLKQKAWDCPVVTCFDNEATLRDLLTSPPGLSAADMGESA
ncbi:MAG: hypothetical protein ACJ8C4_16500 [Gemmataceae bacterium]